MAMIHSKERVIKCAVDYKIKVVELTEKLDAYTAQIVDIGRSPGDALSLAALKNGNNFLKKWEQFLKGQKQADSDSWVRIGIRLSSGTYVSA